MKARGRPTVGFKTFDPTGGMREAHRIVHAGEGDPWGRAYLPYQDEPLRSSLAMGESGQLEPMLGLVHVLDRKCPTKGTA